MKTGTREVTAVEALELIERKAGECVVTEIRDGRGMKIGQGGRQGDIYVWRVADNWPRGKKIENRQMAVGNTAGSRHIAAGNVEVYDGAKLPDFLAPNTFMGPCIVVKDDTFTGTHPEHAHFWLSPGTYQVTHQMDARSLQRVQD